MKIKISGPFEMTPEVLEAKENRRLFLKEVHRKKQLKRRERERRLLDADVSTLELGQIRRRQKIEERHERQRLAQKARYEAHREVLLAKAKKRYEQEKENGTLKRSRATGPRTDAQKEANRKAQKEWRERNREKVLQAKREDYQGRRVEILAKAQERYKRNREAILAKQKAYYKENSDAILDKKYLDRNFW